MNTLVVYLVAATFCQFTVPATSNHTFGFVHIMEEGDGAVQLADGATGEAQMFVDVVDIGGGQVLFTFRNTGPAPSIIADVYFDNGPLGAIAGLIDADDGPGGHPRVDFSMGANPGDLPGGMNLSPYFETSPGMSADADPPAGTNKNGVDPGESLGVVFDLMTNQTYADTIAAMTDGSLRIGIQVQGFASGGSEAFVSDGQNGNGIIPAPASVLLGGLGIGVVGLLRRRIIC
jgi:hypothetical protein